MLTPKTMTIMTTSKPLSSKFEQTKANNFNFNPNPKTSPKHRDEYEYDKDDDDKSRKQIRPPGEATSKASAATRSPEPTVDMAPSAEPVSAESTHQLIEGKFDQLASKILIELKQAQYSREFFEALEEILKEPIGVKLERIDCTRAAKQRARRQQREKCSNSNGATNFAPHFHRQHQNSNHASGNNLDFPISSYQPKSLPVEVIHEEVGDDELSSERKLSSLSSPIQRRQTKLVKRPTQQQNLFPISKSATISDTANFVGHSTLNNAGQLRQLAAGQGKFFGTKSPADFPDRKQRRRQRRSFKYDKQANDGFADDDDDDDEDQEDNDDEEQDFEDEADEEVRQFYTNLSGANQPRGNPRMRTGNREEPLGLSHSEQIDKRQFCASNSNSFNESKLVKCKSSGDNKSIAALGRKLTQASTSSRAESSNDDEPARASRRLNAAGPKPNPIVRSNTIGHAADLGSQPRVGRQEGGLGATKSQEQRQHIELSSLYKPHMNYSTSVLGNHRLSDDDEIIIIPTNQSPSLMSASSLDTVSNLASGASGLEAAAEQQQIERFSISRTKNFWEKLSKGPNGQAAQRPVGVRVGAGEEEAGKAPGRPNGRSQTLPDSSTLPTPEQQRALEAGRQFNYSTNSASSGEDSNGGQRTLGPQPAIMMSSLGSGGGRFQQSGAALQQRQQQAQLSQLHDHRGRLQRRLQEQQEMNRQNKFRQTR